MEGSEQVREALQARRREEGRVARLTYTWRHFCEPVVKQPFLKIQ